MHLIHFDVPELTKYIFNFSGDGKKGGFGGDKFGDLFNKEDKKGGLGGDGGENPLGVLGIGK